MGDSYESARERAGRGDSLELQATLPAAAPERPALQPGDRMNQYEIIKLLGEGGMGAVFLARDLRLGRRVAIKLLHTHGPDDAERLLAEARTTARFQHDNIVVIHEVGEHGGAPYLVLEYLDGKPLTALTQSGQHMPCARAVEIASAIARALVCAHEAGVVHRDLKPANVVVSDAGTVKVLDFGIAKVLRPQAPQLEPPAPPVAPSPPVVHPGGEPDPGEGAGTPLYMAPEQWGGVEIDHRIDIWSCGILLYQMICGRHPLPPGQLMTTVLHGREMPSLADAAPPGVPRELIEIVDRCLRTRPDERWQTAAELLAVLAPFLPGHRGPGLGADESPYAGLASFQESDAAKFFGRGVEIGELVARIRDRPLIGVVGSSGVGKSSFVRAGVIPALKRSGESWEALIVRPGRRPIEALAWLLRPHVTTERDLADDALEQRRLVETLCREPGRFGHVLRLHAAREGCRLLLFVDQLEELYTQVADPAERAAFTACLSAAADDPTSPLRVVASIRADFLDRIADDRRFAGELASGLYFLGRPGREGLREAIANPAEMAGYRFESAAIVDDMLDHLEATPGALPLLQSCAARLWDTRDRTHRLLTQDSYDALGGVAGALASYADRVVAAIGPPKEPLVRKLLLRLVTAERTRAIVPLPELRELSPEAGEVQPLIDQLVEARLLIAQVLEDGKGSTVEIVHESLIHGWPALRRWLDENQDDAAFIDQLRTAARQWEAKGRDPGLLWRGDALAEWERWRRRSLASMLPLEAAFGAASAAHAARGRRLRRAITAVAVAVTAVFVLALWRANLAESRAKRAAETLLHDSYFEQGRLRVLEGDRFGALEPLGKAYRMGSIGAPVRLLLEEAARTTRARLLVLAGHTGKVRGVEYSPDGKWLATAGVDRTARLWDAETGVLRATIRHADRVGTLAWSPDSRLLASSSQDRSIRVWDVIAGREVAVLPADAGSPRVVFSPDGSLLLVGSLQPTFKLWRIPGGGPAGELPASGLFVGAAFCEVGGCMVTWGTDGVIVWDTATLARRASYPVKELSTAAISRTGALIATGTRWGELVLLRDGREVARRAAHGEMILEIAISADEALVATVGLDRTVGLWSVLGEPRGVLGGHRAPITQIRFTAAGDRIVTASGSAVRLWTASGMPLGELTGHTDVLTAVALRPDGRRLATASSDGTAMVWDLVRAEEHRPVVAARDAQLPVVAFDAAGERLAIGRAEGTISAVDVRTGAAMCTTPGTSNTGGVASIAWTGGEQIAVHRIGASAVELWDVRRCAGTSVLEHPAPIEAMSARSGPRVATAAGEHVRVFRDGHLEASFTGYAGRITGLDIDGDDVLVSTHEPAAVVLDAIGGPARRRVFRAGSMQLTQVWIDRKRGQVLATSYDQLLYIWDAATGALLRTLESAGPLTVARPSPDGSLLVGVGGISPVVWDRESGERRRQLAGHMSVVLDGDFIQDELFASVALDHTAILWDIAKGQPLLRLNDVDHLVVSGDRRSVALIGPAGVRVWSPRAPVPDLDANAD